MSFLGDNYSPADTHAYRRQCRSQKAESGPHFWIGTDRLKQQTSTGDTNESTRPEHHVGKEESFFRKLFPVSTQLLRQGWHHKTKPINELPQPLARWPGPWVWGGQVLARLTHHHRTRHLTQQKRRNFPFFFSKN